MLKTILKWTLLLVASCVLWITVGFPILIPMIYPVEDFVTNNRQDGPPNINIDSAPLTYGVEGTPRVHLDLLPHRTFREYRIVYIRHNNALGVPACPPFELNTSQEWFNTTLKGAVQPEGGYSLDYWTDFKLVTCDLTDDDFYVVITEYQVPVLAGAFNRTISITSNRFKIERKL